MFGADPLGYDELAAGPNESYILVAKLSFVGALGSKTVHQLAVAWEAFKGTVTHSVFNRVLKASVEFQGVLKSVSTFSVVVLAKLAPEGSLPRNVLGIAKQIAGKLTFEGKLAKGSSRAFTASLLTSPTGTLKRNILGISKQIAGTLEPTGTLLHNVRSLAKQIAGSLTSEGALQRGITRLAVAKLESKGAISRVTTRALAAAIEFKGALGHTAIRRNQ